MASAAACRPSGGSPLIAWEDRDSRLLSVGGDVHEITETMAIIMDLLLESPGATVFTDRFIHAIYDLRERQEPGDALGNLRVRMLHLRKLGIAIKNIHGTGYRLDLPRSNYAPGTTYVGTGNVGRWRVLKVYREPVAVMISADSSMEELHVPLSSLKAWQLEEDGGGRTREAL